MQQTRSFDGSRASDEPVAHVPAVVGTAFSLFPSIFGIFSHFQAKVILSGRRIMHYIDTGRDLYRASWDRRRYLVWVTAWMSTGNPSLQWVESVLGIRGIERRFEIRRFLFDPFFPCPASGRKASSKALHCIQVTSR
jgi:hypothetical protein